MWLFPHRKKEVGLLMSHLPWFVKFSERNSCSIYCTDSWTNVIVSVSVNWMSVPARFACQKWRKKVNGKRISKKKKEKKKEENQEVTLPEVKGMKLA